jgi:putative nucleotidyltransferase with HDIG domain
MFSLKKRMVVFTIILTLIWTLSISFTLRVSINSNLESYLEENKISDYNMIENNVHQIEDSLLFTLSEYTIWHEHALSLELRDFNWIEKNVLKYIDDEEAYDIDGFRYYDQEGKLLFENDFYNEMTLDFNSLMDPSNGYFYEDRLYYYAVEGIIKDDGSIQGYLLMYRSLGISSFEHYLSSHLDHDFISITEGQRKEEDVPIQKLEKYDIEYGFQLINGDTFYYNFMISFSKHHNNASRLYNRIQIQILVISFIFIFMMLIILQAVVNKLNQFNKDIDIVANGHYSYKIQSYKSIEFNNLSLHINHLSTTVENQIDALKKANLDAIYTLANAVEAKDAYTSGHSSRVMQYSELIANEMPEIEGESLRIAALLHDIGKIGIPESILNKSGTLTKDEFEQIKDHPKRGYEILRDSKYLSEIRSIILEHHERMDGLGYPQALKGSEIKLEARILAVADTFDAIVSDRSYRKGRTLNEAFDILKEVSGSQLDGYLVEVFLEKKNEIFEIYEGV